ncbi:winged helix-turn-helix domain-containing protein [Gemmatimonadota bacterium]
MKLTVTSPHGNDGSRKNVKCVVLSPLRPNARRILEIIHRSTWFDGDDRIGATSTRIAEELSLSINVVRDNIARMKKRGLIESETRKRKCYYFLTVQGIMENLTIGFEREAYPYRGWGGSADPLTTVDVDYLLEDLGIEVNREVYDEINCICPFHSQDGETEGSMWLNRTNTLWRCGHCGKKGNGTVLVSMIRGIPTNEAHKYIMQLPTRSDTEESP